MDDPGGDDQGGPRPAPRTVFRRGLSIVWRYARREPLVFTLAIVGATGYAAAVVATTAVLGWVTDELILPAFADGGEVTTRAAVGGALVLVLMGVLRASSIVLRRFSAGVLTFRTAADLRRRVTSTLVEVPLDYHRAKPTGELLAHADADVLAATEVLNPVPFSAGVLALVVFAMASLLLVDPVLALVALVLFPALALLNRVYTNRVAVPVAEVQARVGDVSRLAHESFDGALVVKTLGLADREVQRMGDAADALRRTRVEVGRIRASFEPGIDALPNLGIIALLLVGAWQLDAGNLAPGDLVQAMALFGWLAFPVRIVGFFLQELPRSVAATTRIDEVLAAEPGPAPGRGLALPDGPLGLSFEGVAFAYPDGTQALHDVTFSVAPGEVVALVGATGGGKTTLCDLVVRLAEPTSGAVRVGGVDVAAADPAQLRRAVALVFQESFLFADRLADNVDLDGGTDPAVVARAAEVARAAGFVHALPAGWDTVVGERGVTLSGGQRQRIALARALARQPRVLVLDDATSAVDPVVEAEILAGLRRGAGSVGDGDGPSDGATAGAPTTLVVAHRLSTIRLADRVVFLEGGRVAGVGHHDALLALPGYRRIVQAYEQGEDPVERTGGEAR